MTGKNFLTKREFEKLYRASPTLDDFLQNTVNLLIEKFVTAKRHNPPDVLDQFVNDLIESPAIKAIYK